MTSPADPTKITPWPLAARLASAAVLPNEWRVLIVPAGQESVIALDLIEELRSLVDLTVEHLVAHSASDLLNLADRNELLVVTGLEHLDEPAWRVVDIGRSRLTRDPPTLLIIADREAERIVRLAPNFWSWVSSAVWTFEPEGGLTDVARDQRLAELRRHYGFDDTELLRRARASEIPLEPDFAEWLLLLGESIVPRSPS